MYEWVNTLERSHIQQHIEDILHEHIHLFSHLKHSNSLLKLLFTGQKLLFTGQELFTSHTYPLVKQDSS